MSWSEDTNPLEYLLLSRLDGDASGLGDLMLACHSSPDDSGTCSL